jgi:peptide/nickel transport system permease protein
MNKSGYDEKTEKTRKKKESSFIIIMRRLAKNRAAMFCLIILLLEILISVIAPKIIPYGYEVMDLKQMLAKPSFRHWFGTDEVGRDIFSRILFGGRYSLSLGIISVLFSVLIGIIVGSIVGFFGGQVDNLIMRFLDILQSIPSLILTIAIATVLGPGFFNTILALSIGSIPPKVRLLRASILNIRKMEYLEAASLINCSKFRITLKHILPNSISPIIVSCTMSIGYAILNAAGLSYIGLGVKPPSPEWGAMLSAGRGYIRDYPHIVMFPGVAIMITVLVLNIFGDGIRDALDPKLKN